ncbi:gustatory receptor 10a-like [Teleopsis dalmanni]|nr:gustatory receptor 10a-like [Teleopsis dalmanni]
MNDLIANSDGIWQLELVVNVGNTVFKYIVVVITYIANHAHYDHIYEITSTRQRLEDIFDAPSNDYQTDVPKRRFETMLLFKFGLINSTMGVQLAHILYQYCTGAPTARAQFTIYTFVLWNYTENMADYFFFMNASALKFCRQLHVQLKQLTHKSYQVYKFNRQAGQRGMTMQLCVMLCDRLDILAQRYHEIYELYSSSVHMHQWQMLGLVLTTLISNLTNCYTIYSLFVKHKLSEYTIVILLSTIHALAFYLDTYIVILTSDSLHEELKSIKQTMRLFNESSNLDIRLDQTIENFMLKLLSCKIDLRICGLFKLDLHLAYLIAATAFSYFITLIQFELNLNNLQ